MMQKQAERACGPSLTFRVMLAHRGKGHGELDTSSIRTQTCGFEMSILDATIVKRIIPRGGENV